MKYSLVYILACYASFVPGQVKNVTVQEAVKILGQPVTLVRDSVEESAAVTKFKSVFRADSRDPLTNRTVNLFCSLEHYTERHVAQAIMEEAHTSNREDPGWEVIRGLGDQAFKDTDDENFYLIMFRKKNVVFRSKINKLTRRASPENLLLICQRLAAELP